MLIVNADDFGASVSTTDPILDAFDIGAISSTTAMVWMRDSERAATIGIERGIAVGLHLNLTMAFNGRDVPHAKRERQLRLTEYFDKVSWRKPLDRTPPAGLLRYGIADQMEEFRRLYGEPTHIDGHHHVHLNETVLDLLPRHIPVRSFLRSPQVDRAHTDPRERSLRERFLTPEITYSFPQLHPALGGSGFDVLAAGDGRATEVMTHPQSQAELDALRSQEWLETLARLKLGSYSDLAAIRASGVAPSTPGGVRVIRNRLRRR